jgi:hypothetical protein
LILGLYLANLHHQNNFDLLMKEFGIEFGDDLLMPLGRETFQDGMDQSFAYQDSDFWITTRPKAAPNGHEILHGISEIGITSACSVKPLSKPDLLVSTAEQVAVMHAVGRRDSSGRLYRIDKYLTDRHDSASFMAAVKHGDGKVVAVGSWKVFLNSFTKKEQFGNKRLFVNTIKWLVQ